MENYSYKEFKRQFFIKENLQKLNAAIHDGYLTSTALQVLNKNDVFRIWGVSYLDVSHVNFFKLKKEDFDTLAFSSSTVFAAKMPKYFNKQKLLTFKKCNLKIEDSDVCMAVIDNPTQFYLHNFFKGKNIELVDFSNIEDDTHFHMEGVLANIFKYANNPKIIAYTIDWNKRSESVLKALKDVSRRIIAGQKINVVSISNQLIETTATQSLKTKILKAVENLKQLDCEVLDSAKFSSLNFASASRTMFSKDVLSAYKNNFNVKNRICVPASRIIPEFASKNGYAIGGMGFSWAIPIVAYLYAVCKKYNVNLTIQDFASACQNTATTNKSGDKILNIKKVLLNYNIKFKVKIATGRNIHPC